MQTFSFLQRIDRRLVFASYGHSKGSNSRPRRMPSKKLSNLDTPKQREELEKLIGTMEVLTSSPAERRLRVNLPQKDQPILLDAIEAKASYLITGDITHFGRYFGKRVEGVLILTPSAYLVRKKKR